MAKGRTGGLRLDADQELQAILGEPFDWLEQQGKLNPNARGQSTQLLEDLAKAEDRATNDYSGRFAIELLQNAHDASADHGKPGQAWFSVTDSALLVGNQGEPFNEKRLRSLMRFGTSEKAEKHSVRSTIGYKGIGFSAVFEITNTPQIWSEAIAFEFDRRRAKGLLDRHLGMKTDRVPSRRFPFEIGATDLESDADEVARLLDLGAVTVIRLPFKPRVKAEDVARVVEETLAPEALIFMPALKALEIAADGDREEWNVRRQTRGESQLVSLKCSDASQSRTWRVLQGKTPAPKQAVKALAETEEAWEGVKALDVAVGVPWSKNKPRATEGGQNLRVYFPTDDQLARSVLVHGDFVVQSNRRYVLLGGIGQSINERIAEHASTLLVKLAEEIAEDLEGPELLECLSKADGVSHGFGEFIDELIDEKLKSAKIVPPAEGDRRRKAKDLLSLDLDSPRTGTQLLPLLKDRGDLVSPVATEGIAGDLLVELGSEMLDDEEIAQRIDVQKADVQYEDALRALRTFIGQTRDFDLDSVIETIRGTEVFQYEKKGKLKWARPSAIFRLGPKSPELPISIRPPEFRPGTTVEKDLSRSLQVRDMTPEVAIEFVLDEIEQSKSLSKKRSLGFTTFLRDLWRESPGTLKDFENKLGVVPLPVTEAKGKPGKRKSRRADQVYFPESWVPDSPAEKLYGWFKEEEFLAEPESLTGFKDDLAFFRLLGVAESPRVLPVDVSRDFSFPREFEDWVEQDEVRNAWVCPDGHQYVARRIQFKTVDRLDELLERGSRKVRRELAKYLSSQRNPYGGKATIQCCATQHSRPQIKEVSGFQRFQLEESEWIPVKGDPRGKESRRPNEAWLPFSDIENLDLPIADIPRSSAKGLGLVRAVAPGPDSLVAALNDLSDFHEELADAPDSVLKTAEWLLKKLDRSLRNNTTFEIASDDVRLPARSGSTWTWSTAPLLGDLPGLESLEALEVLPPGQWTGLRRRLNLTPASQRLTVTPRVVVSVGKTGLLPEVARAQLAALLVQKVRDTDHIYGRLGRLRDKPVGNLELEITDTEGGESSTAQLESYIHQTLTKNGRVQRADLLWVSSHLDDGLKRKVAQQLDEYIAADVELHETIYLYLLDRREILGYEGTTTAEVEEALREIRSRSAQAGKHDLTEFAEEWTEDEEELDPEDHLEAEEPTEPPRDQEPRPVTNADPWPPGQGPQEADPPLDPEDPHESGDGEGELLPTDDNPTNFPQLDRRKAKAPPEIDLNNAGVVPPSDRPDSSLRPKRPTAKVDWDDREKRNRKVGNRGEEWALDCERKRLTEAGLDPDQAKWISQEVEGSPYDIESKEEDGSPRYIEVKTTTGPEIEEPFEMSEAEFQFAQAKGNQHILCRIADAGNEAPKVANYRNIASLVGEDRAHLERSQVRVTLPPELAD